MLEMWVIVPLKLKDNIIQYETAQKYIKMKLHKNTYFLALIYQW